MTGSYSRWAGTEPVDPPDPDLDDLTRDQLAELGGAPPVVAEVLDSWLSRAQGLIPGRGHYAGLFLDMLAAEGYRVEPIDTGPPLSELLPPPKE